MTEALILLRGSKGPSETAILYWVTCIFNKLAKQTSVSFNLTTCNIPNISLILGLSGFRTTGSRYLSSVPFMLRLIVPLSALGMIQGSKEASSTCL